MFNRSYGFIVFSLIFAFMFISVLIINKSITIHHLVKTLSLTEFEAIYKAPNLSSCIWVYDDSFNRSKSIIAPSEVVRDKMINTCRTAEDAVYKNFTQSKENSYTKEDVVYYIGTTPWIVRYKIVFPEWENHVDAQLKNALSTW